MALIVGHIDELGYVETRLTKKQSICVCNGIASYTDDFDFENAFPVEKLKCIYFKEDEA